MKPYLIVLDLDGTLLNDKKIITPKTVAILQKAQAAGHYVMFATGRAYRMTAPYYQQLQLNTPIVNFNGAFVHHPSNTQWQTIHKPLRLQKVQEMMHSLDRFFWENIVAEVTDDVYIHRADEQLAQAYSYGNARITIGELQRQLTQDPTNLLINTPVESAQAIQHYLTDQHADEVGHRLWASPWGNVVEIFSSGLNKAYGVMEVANWLNIPRERIIAFGDENNDFEMIEFAGTGVAMGNAIDELKSLANVVAPATNNEDGIVEILENYIPLPKE